MTDADPLLLCPAPPVHTVAVLTVPGDADRPPGTSFRDDPCRVAPVCGDVAWLLAPVAPADLALVQYALHNVGPLHAELDLPTSARVQHLAGRTWRDTLGPSGVRGSWGRHAVHVYGYNRAGPVCRTWGRDQQMTWAFWRTCAVDAYAVLSPHTTN